MLDIDGMTNEGISLIATVECRAESRGEEQPIAVVIGGQRFEIVNTLDRVMMTSVEAGQPIRNRLWVEIEDGRKLELSRTLPNGPWRVKTTDKF